MIMKKIDNFQPIKNLRILDMKKLFILMLIALSIPLVMAFGVVTPYWKENPLIMYPGESKEVSFNLQNMVGDKDYAIRVALLESSNIALITDASTDYLIRAKTDTTYVHMIVSIPSDAAIGAVYPITMSFSTITAGNEGVSLGSSIEKSFNVVIGKEIAKPAIPAYTWIIVAVIIVIIVLLSLKRKTPEVSKRRK